jgi:hypothetical protein
VGSQELVRGRKYAKDPDLVFDDLLSHSELPYPSRTTAKLPHVSEVVNLSPEDKPSQVRPGRRKPIRLLPTPNDSVEFAVQAGKHENVSLLFLMWLPPRRESAQILPTYQLGQPSQS